MSEWLLHRDGTGIVGPVDSRLVLDGIADGRVPSDTKVRGVGETAWRGLEQIPVFSLAIRQAPPRDTSSLQRAVFDGFEEAAAEPAHSLRPVQQDAAWDAAVWAPPKPSSRRARAGAAIGGGATLGIVVVLLVLLRARSMPSSAAMPAVAARALVRTSATLAVRRVIRSFESQEQPAAEEPHSGTQSAVATAAPHAPRVAPAQQKRNRPAGLNQPGF